jgi:hypothetical protein
MRYIFLSLMLSTVISGCKTSSNTHATVQPTVTSIVHGTSFGHCHGYCKSEEIYSFSQVTFVTFSRDTTNYPRKEKTENLPDGEMKRLTSAINWEKWNAMDTIIGCPDCTDAGAEYLIITTTKGTKKVLFDAHSNPEGLETLLAILRGKRRIMEREEQNNESEE